MNQIDSANGRWSGERANLRKEEVDAHPDLAVESNHSTQGGSSGTNSDSQMELDARQLALVVRSVPGGRDNVQDIYPLTPLQEGLLYHYLLNKQAGTYVLSQLLEVESRSLLDRLISGLQRIIDRYDILRIAVLWEDLPRPLQVVSRGAKLCVEECTLEPKRDIHAQLNAHMDMQQRNWDLRRAPALHLYVASDPCGEKWYAMLHVHHVVCDYGSLNSFVAEVAAYIRGEINTHADVVPYREHVERVLGNARVRDGEIFFRRKIGDVTEPTAPFGVMISEGEAACTEESRQALDKGLSARLRAQARKLGVSNARVFHAAWSVVLAHISGRDDVVFGTVLLANWQRKARSSRGIGISINTLPLRLRLSGLTTAQLVDQTDRELTELLDFEQVSLVLAQRCSDLPPSTPLFSTLLNYRHPTSQAETSWSSVEGVRLLAARGARTNYPIALIVDDLRDDFMLIARTDKKVDSRRVLAYMATALQSLATSLERSPSKLALTLEIMPEAERRRLTDCFVAAKQFAHRDMVIHQAFEEQVARTPSAPAITFESQSMSYAEVNHRANRLARHLKNKGVGPDDLVAICIERGPELVIGLIGILKSGGAYVPLDPRVPSDRLDYMLRDSGARIILTQAPLRERFASTSAEVVLWNDDGKGVEQIDAVNLDAKEMGLSSRNLAYVIYTSGSTGKPKGVMVEHRNVLRLFSSTDSWFGFNGEDVWTLFHSSAFDFSVWELWGALLYGGRLVVVPHTTARSPREFYKLICDERVTVLNQTPSAFVQLIGAQAEAAAEHHSLRVVIFGGEALELYKLRPWVMRNDLEQTKLVNMYGITETTVHVTYHQLTAEEIASGRGSPIGVPIPDLQLCLLDRHKQLTPVGVVGEIYVGGAGLARGYLSRSGLSAERFGANPFSDGPNVRLYRSGDLGRMSLDGKIEYLGRNDSQVKIRGFRIELGEIEVRLAGHSDIKDAAVIAQDYGSEERRLLAYVVPRVRGLVPSADSLRSFLSASLPDYMVPSAFVVLERLPLTSNGKLDRKALPQPGREAYASQSYEAPQGEIEATLASIWRALLAADRVSRFDSFFNLGGHSLLVLKLLYMVRQVFSVALKVADVYNSPTLQELAARIRGTEAQDAFVSLATEGALDGDIRAIAGKPRIPARAILLTGSTGFVGRFVLAELLSATDATIYCLVRGQSRELAASRLRAVLSKWDLLNDEFERRVIAIPGNLSLPGLGLAAADYQTLVSEVDSIYHSATSMNHLENYKMAKPTNVDAITDLLRIATTTRPKQVNYISSLSVFGERSTSEPRVVTEETAIENERHLHSRGYIASKWVGERIFQTASERGILCNIFRVGLVWADMKKGRYDESQREYRVIKSCLLSGYGIKDHRFAMPPTPVDYVARAIVTLANRSAGRGVFHLSASKQRIDGLFECCNRILQRPLALIPLSEWVDTMQRLHNEGRPLPIMPLIEAAFGERQSSLYEASEGHGTLLTQFDCSRTHLELAQAGIVTPEFDERLLGLCIDDMRLRDGDLRKSIGGGRVVLNATEDVPLAGNR